MTTALARFTPSLFKEHPGPAGFGEPWALLRHLPDLLARMAARIDRDAYRITTALASIAPRRPRTAPSPRCRR